MAGVSTNLRTLLDLRKLEEISDDSLLAVMSDNAVRRSLAARTVLFSEGDAARGLFLVESGRLLVRRQRVRATRPTSRILSDGDLFTYDCDGVRAATCEAITDCLVLQIDRQKVIAAAQSSPLLARLMRAVHSAELEMILESLDGSSVSSLAVLSPRPRPARSVAPAPHSLRSATILRPRFRGR